MPVYEFYCEKCDKRIEKLFRTISSATTTIECPDCHSILTKEVSNTSFTLQGDGWTGQFDHADPAKTKGGGRVENPTPYQSSYYKR